MIFTKPETLLNRLFYNVMGLEQAEQSNATLGEEAMDHNLLDATDCSEEILHSLKSCPKVKGATNVPWQRWFSLRLSNRTLFLWVFGKFFQGQVDLFFRVFGDFFNKTGREFLFGTNPKFSEFYHSSDQIARAGG